MNKEEIKKEIKEDLEMIRLFSIDLLAALDSGNDKIVLEMAYNIADHSRRVKEGVLAINNK